MSNGNAKKGASVSVAIMPKPKAAALPASREVSQGVLPIYGSAQQPHSKLTTTFSRRPVLRLTLAAS